MAILGTLVRTLVVCLEELHQVVSVVINCALKRRVAEFISQATVGASPEQDVNSLNVSSHARYVQGSIQVVVHLVHLASSIHKFLHNVIVASTTCLVKRIILVYHCAIRASSLAQKVLANFRAVVTHGPIQWSHCESLAVLEQVVDALVYAVQLTF